MKERGGEERGYGDGGGNEWEAGMERRGRGIRMKTEGEDRVSEVGFEPGSFHRGSGAVTTRPRRHNQYMR